jgi:hypothetical protein
MPANSHVAEPFMSILNGFAAATSRLARELSAPQRKFRCPECGAVTRVDPDDPRESVACWTADRDIICTGRAVANPTSEAMADLRAWQFERAAR